MNTVACLILFVIVGQGLQQPKAQSEPAPVEKPAVTVSSKVAFAKSTETLVATMKIAGNIVVVSAENPKGFEVPDNTKEDFKSLKIGEPGRAKDIVLWFQSVYSHKGEKDPLLNAVLTPRALKLTFQKAQPWNQRKQRLLQILEKLFDRVETRADIIVIPPGRNLGASPAAKWQRKSDVQRQVKVAKQ